MTDTKKTREFMYILKRLGVNVKEIRLDRKRAEERRNLFISQTTNKIKKEYVEQLDRLLSNEEHHEYQSQNSFPDLEVSEEDINGCRSFLQNTGITAEVPVIEEEKPLNSGEKNYKPEVQEFGILATKVVLRLIENNVVPATQIIIELVKRDMDISKISETTIKTYCSFIKKIIRDEKYTDKVLSGEISVNQAYREISRSKRK